MADPSIIRINPNSDIQLQDTGGGQRFAVVDDFLLDPHTLVPELAEWAGKFVSQPLGHPSRSRDIDVSALDEIHRFVRSRLSRLFPFHRGGIVLSAFLSNVSLKPEQLSVFHRMCHIDPRTRPDHHTFAGVIYLFSDPELGGTAFYRWKAKDVAIEAYRLAQQSQDTALRYLEEHSAVYRKPPEYMTSSNDIAELLSAAPARFNRLVFYDGEIPHSGHITHPELLSADPLKGRLTLNLCASVKLK